MMDYRDKSMESGVASKGNGPSKSQRFEEAKNAVANRLHDAAGALRDAVGGAPESESGVGRYGYQASHWLDESAEYIRRFDYQQADAEFREYVRRNPARCLVIAGVAGALLGAVMARR
jgi:ElaB/YqjD/DUF883 family membrane-anchored ribosome-binding protein